MPMFDEEGHRARPPAPYLPTAIASVAPGMRSALAAALRMEELRCRAEAIGLTDDEVAHLEAQAVEDARRSWLTPTRAFEARLEAVTRGASIRLAETTFEQVGVLSSHLRRIRDLIIIDLPRPLWRFLEWRDRRRQARS